jgi:hypothetical protein
LFSSNILLVFFCIIPGWADFTAHLDLDGTNDMKRLHRFGLLSFVVMPFDDALSSSVKKRDWSRKACGMRNILNIKGLLTRLYATCSLASLSARVFISYPRYFEWWKFFKVD